MRVLIDLSDWRDADLDADCQRISVSMTANPHFLTLSGLVADVVDASAAYHTAFMAAPGGGKDAHNRKEATRDTLLQAIRVLGFNINLIAKGDKELLDTTGYPLTKGSSGRKAPKPLITLAVGHRSISVTLKANPDAGMYLLQYTQAPVTESSVWSQLYMQTTTAVINGLESDSKYAFRMAYLFHLEEPEFSDVALSKTVE